MYIPLLRFKELLKCITIILVMSLFPALLKAQVTISSLTGGDFINGTTGNYVLNGAAGTGPTYFRTGNLMQGIAIDGSNNIAFTQLGTTSISRIDGSHIINFPAATNIGALAIDRNNEFIYAASPALGESTTGIINRYIWKNTGSATSIGYYVGAVVSTSATISSATATIPFITSGDLVFINGTTPRTALSIGINNLSLAFDPAGNLYYADDTYNMVREISIQNVTPSAVATGASTITLTTALSATVKAGDEVSGLYIPASTYIGAISGNSITLVNATGGSVATTGAIDGTSTLAIITGVSNIVGVLASATAPAGAGTAGTTIGATAGATPIVATFGLTFDPSGNLFLSDQNNTTPSNPRILKISAPISSASTIALFGSGYSNRVQGIATDVNGNLYAADKSLGKILKISANGGAASVLVGTAGSLSLSTYTTTAGSPVITTTDLTDLLKIDVGMKIRGTGIPAGAVVTAINNTTSPYTLTISTPGGVTTATPDGTATSGSTSLTVSNANSIVAGLYVAGAGIPANTTVVSLSGTTVTLSAPTTAALATTPLFFYTAANYTTLTSATSNSSSEDGFTTSPGSYGYIENPYGIVVSNDPTSPFIVYPEQYEKYVRKLSGSSITTLTAVPTITSFTPAGPVLAGSTITITGTNFTGATSVSFGGNNAASFTVVSATSITAVIGTGTTGNIYVTTPGGTAFSAATLKVYPVISSFTPTSGPAGGTVTITGNNFLGATAVSIGGTAVTSFIVNNNTTITAVAGAGATGTIAVTTSAGAGTSTGTFTFVTAPSALVYSTNTATTNYGTAGTSVAPTVNGGVPTYSLTGTVPAGVTINSSTGVISYSNTVLAGTYHLTVTATNNFPGSTTTTYTITVNPVAPSALVYSPATLAASYGIAGASVAPTINNGGTTITYSLSGTVPAGISIDPSSGIISYNTTLSLGSYPLTVNAANSVASTTTAYTITVNVTVPSSLVYNPAGSSVNGGTAGASASPSINTGGAVDTYSLTGTIPSGVTIDPSTGIISFNNTLPIGSYTLSVVATNSVGNTTASYTITINPVAPSSLSYSPATLTGNYGTTGASVAPAINSGGGVITYSLSGTIPSGISIDPSSGIISYSNTLLAGSYSLTVNAANTIASTTATYTITINAVAPSSLAYSPAGLTAQRGTSGVSISPTIISGGIVDTYSLTGTVPSGITIDPSTGIISYDNTLSVGAYPLTVNATNSVGNTTTTFTITIIPSSNSNLNNLSINSGTLTPVFNSGTTSYSVSVPFAINTVTFTPTVSDIGHASVQVNGTTVTSGSASGPIALVVGANTINIVVTAQDESTQTYSVIVTRGVVSTNAQLSSLTLSSGPLTPGFNSTITSYTASVPNATTSVTLTPALADATATVTVNGAAVANGSASGAIALKVGANIINTIVKAQDGLTIITYTVTITRAASGNSILSNLVLDAGSLSPAFVSTTFKYTATVAGSIASITITPTVADPTAIVTINGTTVGNGKASDDEALNVGLNYIVVVVTAQNGTVNTYTLTITRGATTTDLVTVHNGVSPNGDGINDYLVIDRINSYPDNKLTIVNPNGAKVYETSGYDNNFNHFDGHSSVNGTLMQAGTYFYELDLNVNGETKRVVGYIVLKYN